MIRSSMSVFALAAAAFCCLAVSSPAMADWQEDFNGSTLDNTWLFGGLLPNGNPSPTFSPIDQGSNFSDAIVNSQLQMADTNAAAAGGAVNAFGVVLENFTDVQVTGTLNPNGNSASSDTIALIARGNIGNGQFYGAELSFEDGNFIIFRNDGLDGSGEDLATVNIASLTNATSVFVDFRLVGSSLTADAYDAPGGNLLGSVATTDSNYSTGLSGVLTFFAGDVNKPLLGEFDDLSSVVIPEPTSLALAVAALCAGVAARRR